MQVFRRLITVLMLICLVASLPGCNRNSTALTDAESAAITDICGVDPTGFTDITREVLSKELTGRFPAVVKVYRHENLYAFISKPVGYNGPITLALVIDSDCGRSLGLRIVSHDETPHYVRDMENMWFMERFADKSVNDYLTIARLHALSESDIVAITGATVTTEAVVNGVNAAFGVFQESLLSQTAADVPYMVRFEPGQGDGPVETGYLSIRAYGVVLAEVSLEDIRGLPSVRRTMSIHSTAGITQHSFRGTLLSNVLDLVDPELKELYRWVLAVGVDDFISGISMDEVRAENSVFIMYEDNDQPLPKRNDEPGAMRIVVISDIFGQRFTNYMLEIILENEVP